MSFARCKRHIREDDHDRICGSKMCSRPLSNEENTAKGNRTVHLLYMQEDVQHTHTQTYIETNRNNDMDELRAKAWKNELFSAQTNLGVFLLLFLLLCTNFQLVFAGAFEYDVFVLHRPAISVRSHIQYTGLMVRVYVVTYLAAKQFV